MVAVQVALTLLMLTAAGAAGKGFLRLAAADLGYDPQNTMSLPIPVHDGTYQTWKERSEYFERLRAAVAAMPQVVSAGISTNATPPANGGDSTLEILGASTLESHCGSINQPRIFRCCTYRSRRDVSGTDGESSAVRRSRWSTRQWPGSMANGDAIGRQFRFATMRDEPRALRAVGADGSLRSSALSPTRATMGCATRSSPPSTCRAR